MGAAANLGRDLGDLKLRQVLPVALHPAVMLLGLHLVNEDLGALELLEDLGLNSHILEVRLANGELTVDVVRNDPSKLDLGAGLGLDSR